MKQVLHGGNQYMYPKESSGICRNPKPYHFWLSAYFSRSLIRQGYSPEVASAAAFVVANGYQMNRNLANGRAGKVDSLLSKPFLHPTNNVIRMDLVQAAAGAVYGSAQDNSVSGNFNLAKSYDRAMALAKACSDLVSIELKILNGSEDIKTIYAWNRYFAPAAFFP